MRRESFHGEQEARVMLDLQELVITKEEEVRGERTEETNASTLVRVTSRVTISPKIHCEQTQM